MSFRFGNYYVIQPEPPSPCELCGKIAELRPFGPNDERICASCGDADRRTTERKYKAMIGDVIGVLYDPKRQIKRPA